MAAVNRLNAAQISRLKEPGRYPDGGGLYLRIAEYVTKAGSTRSKNWIFRFERSGRERFMGLGPLDTLSLADARSKARECRQALLNGEDPIDQRRERSQAAKSKQSNTIKFKAAAEIYIETHRSGWRNAKHAAQWPSTLSTYVYPKLGSVPVADVGTDQILECLRPIWTKIPDTATRVRGRIEKVLDWSKARGFRSGENPARWRGHLDQLLSRRSKSKTVRHHPALPYVDHPEFMRDLRARESISARALEFTILTCARTTECREMHRTEVDLSKRLWPVPIWIIPGGRMKGEREHIVPLSPRAVEIIKSLPVVDGDSGFIFPGARAGRPISDMAMLELLRGMRPGFTVHGFRSTFRDWAGDCTNFPRDLIETALSHAVDDETEAAYRRMTAVKKRFRLMSTWSKFCESAPARTTEMIGGA